MKKFNYRRLIWVSGIFLILITILGLVVLYKVKYEDMEVEKYLYFYNCEEALCVTTNKKGIENEENIYSTYKCTNNICPSIDRVIDSKLNIAILTIENSNNKILYNYKKDITISSNYTNYYPLYKDNKILNYLVSNEQSLMGLIDNDNKIIINPEYQQLGIVTNNLVTNYSYKNDYITAVKDDKWGVLALTTGEKLIDLTYETFDLLKEEYSILK